MRKKLGLDETVLQQSALQTGVYHEVMRGVCEERRSKAENLSRDPT
jgi:hypothetical protein